MDCLGIKSWLDGFVARKGPLLLFRIAGDQIPYAEGVGEQAGLPGKGGSPGFRPRD